MFCRNIPAGVLYDLLAPQAGPWSLTLHFRNFPSKILPLYSNEKTLEESYFNSLKEASYIVRHTAEPVIKMVTGARDDLWKSIMRSDKERYFEIMQSLRLTTPITQSTTTSNEPSSSSIPIRVFIRQGARSSYITSYENIEYTSRPAVTSSTVPASGITLLDALIPIIQGFFPSDGIKGNSDDQLRAWAGKIASVHVCGLEPPLSSSLRWLHENLHAPDYFLYIVVFLN